MGRLALGQPARWVGQGKDRQPLPSRPSPGGHRFFDVVMRVRAGASGAFGSGNDLSHLPHAYLTSLLRTLVALPNMSHISATAIMRTGRDTSLKRWAVGLAARIGRKKSLGNPPPSLGSQEASMAPPGGFVQSLLSDILTLGDARGDMHLSDLWSAKNRAAVSRLRRLAGDTFRPRNTDGRGCLQD